MCVLFVICVRLASACRIILLVMMSEKKSNDDNGHVSASSSFKSKQSTTRFADYFVICGLDLQTGLEPDRFAGALFFFDGLLSVFTYMPLSLWLS